MCIRCPFCGPREQVEFAWLDAADVVRPTEPASTTDAAWTDYLYFRRGTPGASLERWHHLHGCGAHFTRRRDSVTHARLDE